MNNNKEQQLVIKLSGGCPWGFRLQGGAGTNLPLIVSKVSVIFLSQFFGSLPWLYFM